MPSAEKLKIAGVVCATLGEGDFVINICPRIKAALRGWVE